MDKFISKFNPYETLAMLIPGAMLVYLTLYLLQDKIRLPPEIFNFGIRGYKFNDKIVSSILFITISYVIGVLHHSLMNCIFKPILRNNAITLMHSIKKLETGRYCEYVKNLLDKMAIYIGNNSQRSSIVNVLENCKDIIFYNGKNIDLTDKYYNAYYYVFSKNAGGSVASIERQIHFIRNMIAPIIMLFIIYVKTEELSDYAKCISFIVCLFFIIALFILMIERQQKVHEAVFENYEYLKRLEEQITNTSVNNSTNSNTSRKF